MIAPKTVRALGEDDLEQMFAVREVAFLEPADLSDARTLQRYKDGSLTPGATSRRARSRASTPSFPSRCTWRAGA